MALNHDLEPSELRIFKFTGVATLPSHNVARQLSVAANSVLLTSLRVVFICCAVVCK